MEVNEGNEVIARWMDLDIDGINVTDGIQETTLDKLKYHTSWDWLHSAWDKFRDLEYHTDNRLKESSIIVEHARYCGHIEHAIANFPVRTAFDELVKGITWYNSIKKA